MSLIPATNNIGIAIIIIGAVFGALSILFCGLRLWSHKLRGTSLGWSDYFLVIALVFAVGLMGGTVDAVVQGLGMSEERVRPEQLIELAKGLVMGIMLWVVSIAAVRISVLIFYMNLFEVRLFRFLCWAAVVVNATTFFIVVLVAFTICQPFAFHWDKGIPNGYCGNEPKFYLWMGIWNLISDVVTIALSLPILWRLRMPARKKISLTCIFCMGLVVCTLTLVRVVQTSVASPQNLTQDYASIGILSLLEPLVGIISACLPFMGPVVKQIFGSDLSADAHEKKRQNSDPFNPVITIGSSTKRTDFKVLDEAELENLSLPPGVSNYTYVGAQSSTSSNTLNGILVCEDIKVHRSEE